ncbi:PAS domain S-box protein [Rhizobium herbae]|uniref:histidine kinase n=1 Tax=Rhizobium herbae TaxID=508661 RepID=A0ABS7H972_9HYPH|nr:PAS domain S-box protein [Rhizobium herbae]MBW9063743.1 PAS domain S-box protein [Rhizobium herbae]
MPAKSYPFIDIAVHERVREHFARGDAAVLFSPDMKQVLWSNGEGAFLFGLASIYDFIDTGANRSDAAYRQLETAARQLERSGDKRSFLMRVASGFQRVSVGASVEMITVRPGETAILFAAPRTGRPLSTEQRAARMISGFDDPDTHMAVLDSEGSLLAASAGFDALLITPQTCRALVTAVGRDSDWLLKRPVPTGKGNLPAAIGKLSENPALHLLFAVETILGNLDAGADFRETEENDAGIVKESPPLSTAIAPLLSAAGLPHDVIDELETIEEIPADGDSFTELLEAPEAENVLPTGTLTDAPADDRSGQDTKDEPVLTDTLVSAEEPQQPSIDPLAIAPEAAGPDADEPQPDFSSAEATEQDRQEVEEAITAEAEQTDRAVAEEALDEAQQDADVPAAPSSEPNGLEGTPEEPPLDEDVAATQVETTSEEGLQDEALTGGASRFRFTPNSRAVRFVWKIDADGRFSEISEEFATAVGPKSADVAGQRFTELAARYHLDPGNTIGELLTRRDTWSGKTIYWPVEGTSLQVPVDLAALPTYSRNREFDGFRGFGIVRVADAVEDEQAMGLTFGESPLVNENAPSEIDGATGGTANADNARDDQERTVDDSILDETIVDDGIAGDGTDDGMETVPAEPAAEAEPEGSSEEDLSVEPEQPAAAELPPDDPFRGERPALKLVETPRRRASDKVVELDRHRPLGAETLSRSEQAAFLEIARQLGGTFGKRANEDVPATDRSVADERVLTEPVEETASMKAGDTGKSASADTDTAATAASETTLPETLAAVVPPRTSSNSSLTPELLDNLPIALLVHSGDELFHVNSEFLKLTGYSSLDELREEGGIDALFADDDDRLLDMPNGAMMVIRSDGTLIPVTARLQSIRWEDKSALMMALSALHAPAAPVAAEAPPEDIAPEAEENAEIQALRMETEELHSILETATDGVVVVGAEGEIRSLNRSASALFNYDDGEVRGKPFAMLFAHESQKAVLDYLSGLSGHGVASVLNDGREVIGREASGGFIPLFMTMGRLSSSNGFCAVIRDITQWKRTEEELRNAKRAAETANAHKSDFLARVSHEIRTPLNAIIGFSDMMASEHFGPIGNPRYVEYANDIGRSGRHVLDIVNDLLDISKIEAGEMDLEFTAVEINDAVSEAVSLVQPQANSQRVIIRTSLSGSVPNVVADNRSIKQIALNILSNAIRFTPSGGQIVVSTAYEANGSVVLRIRDTGVGMTRTELEQAMKPFRQVTTGVRKRGDGTGLGLPLTKAMAEANRAQFSISSTPNEGTLVEISFPSQRVLAN